jgi:hypothetical protein
LAGITQRIIDLLSLAYLITIFFVISYMFFGCSPTGIEVIPGKSIMVRFGHVEEKMFKTIGTSFMIL